MGFGLYCTTREGEKDEEGKKGTVRSKSRHPLSLHKYCNTVRCHQVQINQNKLRRTNSTFAENMPLSLCL